MLAQRPMCALAPPGLCSPRVAEGSLRTVGVTVSLPLTTLLLWSPIDRNVRVQKVFNGYLRITNENFLDAYENSNSTEFANLANKVKEAVSPAPGKGALSLLSTLAPPPSPNLEGTAPLPPRLQVAQASRHQGRGPRSPEGGSRVDLAWDGAGIVASLWPAVSLLSFPQLKVLYSGVPSLGPYHKESAVTAFRWVLGRRLWGRCCVVAVGGSQQTAGSGSGSTAPGPFLPQHTLRQAVSRAGVTTGALPGQYG